MLFARAEVNCKESRLCIILQLYSSLFPEARCNVDLPVSLSLRQPDQITAVSPLWVKVELKTKNTLHSNWHHRFCLLNSCRSNYMTETLSQITQFIFGKKYIINTINRYNGMECTHRFWSRNSVCGLNTLVVESKKKGEKKGQTTKSPPNLRVH